MARPCCHARRGGRRWLGAGAAELSERPGRLGAAAAARPRIPAHLHRGRKVELAALGARVAADHRDGGRLQAQGVRCTWEAGRWPAVSRQPSRWLAQLQTPCC